MGNCGNSFAQSVLVLFLWSITSVVGSRSAFSVVTDAVPRIISKKLSTNEVKRPARDCWVKVCESCHIWSLWRLLQNVANTNIQSFPQLRARSDHMNQDESSTLVALTLSSARSSLIMFKSFTWLYSQHWTFNLPLNLWRFSCVQRTNQPWEDSDFHRQLLQARPILDSRARTLQTNPRRRIRRRSKATVVAAVAKSNMQIVAEPNYKPQPCTTFSDYSYRRKFRSQTSDNIDRWKAEQGRGREKRKIRRKKSRRERVRRKKTQMREKVGKSRNTMFFQWFVALGGRKVGSLKRRYGASWREERWKIARFCGAKQILNENAQNTPCSDHFWQLRCRKSARRCGAKDISKSKCTKHRSVGPLLEVQMSKKCALLWREAHFEVKMLKTLGVRTTFGGSDVASLRFTALHYITLHYTPLHYITLHYTPQHYNYNYATTQLRSTTLQLQLHNYTPLHSTALHYTKAHYTTLRYITLHYTPLHYITLHYLPLHFTTLHYTTLHSTTLQLQPQLHNYTPLH